MKREEYDTALKIVSKEHIDELKKMGVSIHLHKNEKNIVYRFKNHSAYLTQNYDLLKNLIAVRYYIMHKYRYSMEFMETLLYLYPKQIFTKREYSQVPKRFRFLTIESAIRTGAIEELISPKMNKVFNTKRNRYYTFSKNGHNAVKDTYELLSGELKFPEEWDAVDYVKKKTSKSKKYIQDLSKYLNTTDQKTKEVFYKE